MAQRTIIVGIASINPLVVRAIKNAFRANQSLFNTLNFNYEFVEYRKKEAVCDLVITIERRSVTILNKKPTNLLFACLCFSKTGNRVSGYSGFFSLTKTLSQLIQDCFSQHFFN